MLMRSFQHIYSLNRFKPIMEVILVNKYESLCSWSRKSGKVLEVAQLRLGRVGRAANLAREREMELNHVAQVQRGRPRRTF